MTREQAAILRLILICAAWAIGHTLTWGLSFGPIGVVVPAALAIGTLVVTEDLGRARPSGGAIRYWRGRRIEDDERRGPWN